MRVAWEGEGKRSWANEPQPCAKSLSVLKERRDGVVRRSGPGIADVSGRAKGSITL
jgi:hypothetical protein